ncbi:pyridine nucleotide-disulfide oxidoreductase [Sedimenticola thiotaurini]|uniref:Pyridine nucleotide-disulfide oxidoreductase n=2 Tax=Sedimenticola thiotaurini TaxID=1543721 RepID=A0A0F7JUS9_9GAMM|nr:FAD-dependent oxidoreductase [Sedimenticola thiotaurini]AKH19372.1 pyridine nucleotide-disulfide oxidoreductase [Sedimenticola thiotaurini]
MNRNRLMMLIVLVLLIASFFLFDLGQYFSLDYLKSQQSALETYRQAHPLQTAALMFLVYVLVTALSLPGAAVMTLAVGAIFGLFWGTVLVSFASTLGATLAFLISRFLLRDMVQTRFGDKLAAINKGIEKDGAFYLFGLRLVPLFPFFVINLAMGLTSLKTITFAWVSQVGMLLGTIVYVNAGTQLGKIDSLSGILSPGLILSFVLLGVFPLIARKILDGIQARQVLKPYRKPDRFDRNLVVIGAGSGGLVSAYIAAAVKARVTLIEKHRMGGDCLNTGCVPSKALIRSARFLEQTRRAKDYGFQSAEAAFDFAQVMERVQRVVKEVEPHDSVERYTGLGVDVIQGEAMIKSPYEVEVNGQTLTTRNIIVATGARPFVPPIPGLDQIPYLTSDDLWTLRDLPKRLLVLGGGPIGCELAQCFARFGSQVTIVEMAPRLMIREDEDVAELVTTRFRDEGIEILAGHTAKSFEVVDGEKHLKAEYQGSTVSIPFDQVLVAVGRAANTSGFGLEELGVRISERRTVEANEFLQTNFPNIYVCGDVTGPYQFTHTAAHQAWYAAVNALFGSFRRFKVDYSVIPFATFTDPEVGRVGLNEMEAKARGVAYEVTSYGLDDLDRAIADGEAYGFVKVLTVPGKDKILGATIVGEHAGDLIAEFVTAMRHGLGLNKILGTIHIYPTWSEANKFAAGNWKRAHAPEKLLQWVERYHAWRRGG